MPAFHERLTDLVHSDSHRVRKPLASLPDYDPTCMKEGHLQKKGQRLKGWKRRWFVCNGRTLAYYMSRKDRKPNAVIALEHCTVEDGGVSETWKSPRIDLTDATSGVTYCLSAEDVEVVEAWLGVLRTAIARCLGQQGASGAAADGAAGALNKTLKAKTLATFHDTDDDEDPFKVSGRGGPRTAALVSAGSSIAPEKRIVRLTSAPSYLNPQARAQRAKLQHQPTSIALENELASGLDHLEGLLTPTAGRQTVIFRPIGAENGILRSLGVERTNARRYYARASTVLPVASEIAAYFILDHAKRAEWDVHFPRSTHVASFDDATDLVHLSGGFRQLKVAKGIVAPHVAGAIGAVVGLALAPMWEGVLLLILIVGGVAGLVLNGIDYSPLYAPRDLLVLRHTRETSVLEKRSPSCDDLLDGDGDGDGDDSPPIVTILEKSVVNELKPPSSGVVRAHVGLSGWLLEPIDGHRTRATFVTDMDPRGLLAPETRMSFLLERLACLNVLAEQLTQARLCGTDEAMDDTHGSVDGDDDDEGTLKLHTVGSGLGVGDSVVEDEIAAATGGFHPSVYMKGMMQIPSGGLKLVDKEVAKKQGGVLKDVIKSAGAKILEGKGAVSLSLPVRIFEPRTNLERLVDLFLYGPTFLNAAADQSDPVERFKLVMAFAVAGMHHSVGQLKPFNPILGETYQSLLNDGTEVCCEHTSHHPPISNFQLVGNKYTICGHILWHGTFSMKSNAVIQNNRGPIRVGFDDGTSISYNLPVMQSGGFLWGDRTIELVGSVIFEDKKNQLQCELKFHPDEKKGMFATKTASDQVRGALVNTATGAELCEVTGSWLEELRFGGRAYWVYGRECSGYTMPITEAKVMASDSRHREDLQYLAANDLDAAQDWKVRLEVLQRADRKARNDGRRPNHWSLQQQDKGGH